MLLVWTLLTGFLLSLARTDTPANCTFDDVIGRWTFFLSKPNFSNKDNCSALTFSVEQKLVIDLTFPNLAFDQDGNTGKWTLVYNQGFEVTIRGFIFFAFSKYVQNGSHLASICNETFNGWYHQLTHKVHPPQEWGCYYGHSAANQVPPQGKVSKYGDLHLSHLDEPFHNDHSMVDALNNIQKTWVATAYPHLEEMTRREVMRMRGGPATPSLKPKIQGTKYESFIKNLPEAFDWRNVGQTNYVSPVRNQGGCGSCYAFSSMAMLEARIRVLTNNTQQPTFSTQEIVSCSFYAQGCDGGFPYLVAGKHAYDVGVVEESCFPYTGKNSACTVDPACTRHFVSSYEYLGGFYGATSEPLMRLELVKNGPFSVSFMVYDDFLYYKGGVYHHTGLKSGFNPFRITNHAVLLVGYGNDPAGGDYWIVKNSWGVSWGEKGFFRIRRGFDECNIESLTPVASPIV